MVEKLTVAAVLACVAIVQAGCAMLGGAEDGGKVRVDFCAMSEGREYVVYVPDLVQSTVRIIRLAR